MLLLHFHLFSQALQQVVNGLWSQFLATNILHMRMRVGHLSLSNMQIAIRQQHEEDEEED